MTHEREAAHVRDHDEAHRGPSPEPPRMSAAPTLAEAAPAVGAPPTSRTWPIERVPSGHRAITFRGAITRDSRPALLVGIEQDNREIYSITLTSGPAAKAAAAFVKAMGVALPGVDLADSAVAPDDIQALCARLEDAIGRLERALSALTMAARGRHARAARLAHTIGRLAELEAVSFGRTALATSAIVAVAARLGTVEDLIDEVDAEPRDAPQHRRAHG
jgi:hypothetical protein